MNYRCFNQTKSITAFSHVWDSQGTQSEAHVSIWAPSVQSSMLSGNKVIDQTIDLPFKLNLLELDANMLGILCRKRISKSSKIERSFKVSEY